MAIVAVTAPTNFKYSLGDAIYAVALFSTSLQIITCPYNNLFISDLNL